MPLRIIDWPMGLEITEIEPLSGPSSIRSGASSFTGFQQTGASPFGLWQWGLSFAPMEGRAFRDFRGWLLDMRDGGAATRWTIKDPDRPSLKEVGVVGVPPYEMESSVYWTGGRAWQNGLPWAASHPLELVAQDAAVQSTIVSLGSQRWGHSLGRGTVIGFAPAHFGFYSIRETISAGRYRIWPPLRKAIKAGDLVTLEPTMIVGMQPESSGGLKRDAEFAQNTRIILSEIEHQDVIRFYE